MGVGKGWSRGQRPEGVSCSSHAPGCAPWWWRPPSLALKDRYRLDAML